MRTAFAALLAAIFVVLAGGTGAWAATSGAYSDEVGGASVAARNSAQALRTSWSAAVTTAGGAAGTPVVLSTTGTISGVFYTAPDGTTASVARTRYTAGSAPTLVGPSSNPGTATCTANGATPGAGLQGGAPRPSSLIGGSAACPLGYAYGESGGAGESTTRDAVEFTFSRPLLAFGAWFGDLETRTDGLGVAAILRLYGAGNVLLSDQVIVPGPSYLPQSNCSNTYTGCGNNTTRWVGFVADPAQPVERMVVIVGDEDAGGTALDEGMGFIGPSFDLSTASISLVKTAAPLADTNGDLRIGAGDTVTYSFVVTNTGTLAVSSVAIVDPDATGLSCPPGSLAANATRTCTGSHVLTQTDVNAGILTNTAYATASVYGGTIQSAQSSTTTAIPAVRSITLVKTTDAGSDSFDAVGDVLEYTVTASNTGNVTLTGVSVTDIAPGAGAFDASDCATITTTLEPGESDQCAVSYTTTQADLDAGFVTNTASASALAPGAVPVGPSSEGATSVAVQSTSLTLTKTVDAPTYSAVGQLLTYTLTVRNAGNISLHDLSITDTPPGSGAFDASDCTALDGSALAPGAELQCTVTYAITQADLNAGSVNNGADASALTPTNSVVTAPQAVSTSTATTTSALTITKQVDSASYDQVGDILTFTITVQNIGTVTLNTVEVTDTGPGTGSCDTLSATLDPTESAQCTLTYAATQNDLDVGSVTNSAFASGVDPDGDPVTSPDASAESVAMQSISLSVVKSATSTTFDSVGDVLSYTIALENDGNVSLSSIAVTDLAPGAGSFALDCSGMTTTLAPGDTTSCTATYSVVQSDLDDGHVTNTASVTAQTTTGAPVSVPDSTVVVAAVQLPSLSLVKTGTPLAFASVGDELEYELTATNSGNVTLTSVTISDGAPGGGAFVTNCAAVLATLAPTETTTCSATYSVTQEDLDHGDVTNSATAAAVSPSGDAVSSGTTQVVSAAAQSPMLTLTKTSSSTSFSAAGELITYSLVITNTGNVTVSTVTIVDTAPGAGAFTSTCPLVAATLAPGASATCTSLYTVTQADIAAGLLTSLAVGEGLVPPILVFSNYELVTLPYLEPTSGLPSTGLAVLPLGMLGLLLLVGGGVVLVSARARATGRRA